MLLDAYIARVPENYTEEVSVKQVDGRLTRGEDESTSVVSMVIGDRPRCMVAEFVVLHPSSMQPDNDDIISLLVQNLIHESELVSIDEQFTITMHPQTNEQIFSINSSPEYNDTYNESVELIMFANTEKLGLFNGITGSYPNVLNFARSEEGKPHSRCSMEVCSSRLMVLKFWHPDEADTIVNYFQFTRPLTIIEKFLFLLGRPLDVFQNNNIRYDKESSDPIVDLVNKELGHFKYSESVDKRYRFTFDHDAVDVLTMEAAYLAGSTNMDIRPSLLTLHKEEDFVECHLRKVMNLLEDRNLIDLEGTLPVNKASA